MCPENAFTTPGTVLLPIAALVALAVALPDRVAAQSDVTGTYEYVSPEATGALRLEASAETDGGARSESGTATVLIETARDGARCRLLGEGQFNGNEARLDLPDGVLTIRLFDNNAEVETAGSTQSVCDAGARIAGIYISTSSNISLDREHIVAAQENLGKLGLPVGRIDGIMGPSTRQAMNRFEAQNNLPQNRNLTLSTFHHLEMAVEGAVASAAEVRPIPVETGNAGLQLRATVPDRHRDLIDTLFGDLVAPQQIDWNNPPFELAFVDLSTGESAADSDRPDIVAFFNDRRFCEADRCRLDVMQHAGDHYVPVLETDATDVELGEQRSNGLTDIVLDGSDTWQFDGERYTRSVYEPEPVR
ncbi:peptidoglycan-binding domain-containing protein [Fodinicurvata sp. EGI_FJ10296]|uniref:peptidoglycan-binding domain-containing protein n=1 Tax=Fodinicurvata sp. EGI_FJ10296 TaxID=3231908 RepID=UPI0034569418